jgi:hypothetical protein
MTASLRAFLSGLIDYAGLFPPAKLPMAAAIDNYVRYRADATAWMLGRFICPASRLNDLSTHDATWSMASRPLVVAALGRGGENAAAFHDGLLEDLSAIAAFRTRHGDRAAIDVYEVKLPADTLTDHDRLASLVAATIQNFERDGPPTLTPYFEVPLVGPEIVDLPVLLAVLARDGAAAGRSRCRAAGVKFRCGGTEPAAFPSTRQLARALAAAGSAGVAVKCTAGLHHPLPRWDASVQAKMHGFVNVFLGGLFARCGQLDEATLTAMLESDQADAFRFDESGASWHDLRLPTDQIAHRRGQGMVSFGSCSFDEPREDLQALGWLP